MGSEEATDMKDMVYLSGKMGGLPVREIVKSRLKARILCEQFGMSYFDPAEREGLYEMPGNQVIDMAIDRKTMADFVKADEAGLDKCSCVLVLTGDTPSDGAWWEMARAYYHLRIPVVMVAPKRVARRIMGFSNVKLSHIFSTIEEAVRAISKSLPTQRKK
jgi:hypothetical protein